MKLLDLFISFAKIGFFTFGGGYSMIPMLEKECVSKHHWITEEELLNFYAISQCTPGVIAVNMGTFIGKKENGIIGGIIATLGVVFPSIVIISLIASLLNSLINNILINKAFTGIRLSVCALITSSVIKLSKNSINDLFSVIIAFISFAFVVLFKLETIYIVLGSIILSIICYLIKNNHDISKTFF